jgi:hypothetical protein
VNRVVIVEHELAFSRIEENRKQQDGFCGREAPQEGPNLAANSSAQLKERHSDDQRVSDKSRDEFHNSVSDGCHAKTIQPSTHILMSPAH